MEKCSGIIVTGGEGPPPEALGRLAGGVAAETLIVAADSGLLLAEAAGLRPDWIIGDMDSLGDDARLRPYPPGNVMRHSTEKDYTDTELALALLWDKGCGEVWIVGGGGGRIDHLFGIRDLCERERFPSRWITANEDIYCIDSADSDASGSLSLGLKPGALVSVFPLAGGPWKAESAGLKWPLVHVRWERGLYGLSNVAVEGEFMVKAQQGRFMVITEGMWRQ
jgi:thiamine pyrophosphokinase